MFAILFEVLLIKIKEEIHHFDGWEGGGLRGTKIMNRNFVNKLAFPKDRDKTTNPAAAKRLLGGRFGYFFSAQGGGRGSPRPPGGGGCRFFIENPRGGVSRRGRAENWGFWGGGGG